MRTFILCFGILGTLVFGAAFALSFFSPLLVERLGKEIIRIEIERRLGIQLDTLTGSRMAGLAQKALGRTDGEIAAVRREIEAGIPDKLASVMADMRRADCECRKRNAVYTQQRQTSQMAALIQMRSRLVELIESAYQQTTASLLREFRIFTASNALVFLALTGVTARRRQAGLQLALPAIVLVTASVVTAMLYLFAQDWLHTVLFSSYIGLAYMAYLVFAIALLSDIAFNRARVCTRAINGIASSLGSAVEVVPC
ncbi:hypothetical protein WKI45_09250 [Delftia tsuruhatensis]